MADVQQTFSTGQVKLLTGATSRQLDWWTWTGFITPSGASSPKRRYTFGDVLKIKMVTQLRERGHSLPLLRRVMQRLSDLSGDSLSTLKLVDAGGELYFCRDLQEVQRATDGQLVWSVMAFDGVARELKRQVAQLVVIKNRPRKRNSWRTGQRSLK